MLPVLIQDFVVSTEHAFTGAVPYEQAGFTAFSESLLQTFVDAVRTTDITLDHGDYLYNYRLSLRMFNGSVDLMLNSAGFTSSFRGGRNTAALQAIGNCIVSLETLLQRFSTQFRQATFATHAAFQSIQEYDNHMAFVLNKAPGYTAGGVIRHCPGSTFDGQIRFTTDKSLAYPNAIFASFQVSTQQKFSKELFPLIEARFVDISKDLQLEFKISE